MNSSRSNKRSAPSKRASAKKQGQASRGKSNGQQSNPNPMKGKNIQSAPIASYSRAMTKKPKFVSQGGQDGRIRVVHNEYIGDLAGSTGFQVNGYPINPGMSQTFPWLSSIARNYESYKFNRLSFHYKTASNTVAVGSVIESVDYDASDPSPVSLQEIFQNHGTVDGQSWSPDLCMQCPVQELNKLPQRYIRAETLLPNQDIKTYDAGNFWIATANQVDNSLLGRLWVDYDVTLMTPQGQATSVYAATISGATGVNKTSVFGTAPVVGPNSFSPVVVGPLGQHFSFSKSGEYLVVLDIIGTGSSPPTLSVSGATASFGIEETRNNSSGGTYVYKVKGSNNGADGINFDVSAWTTVTSSEMYIAPYIFSIP